MQKSFFIARPFQSRVAFLIETNHLISTANQMTSFYMKSKTSLKWTNLEQIQHINQKENQLLKAKTRTLSMNVDLMSLMLTLIHYFPKLHFYNPWKYRKTLMFSDVLREYRNIILGRNGLSKYLITENLVFIYWKLKKWKQRPSRHLHIHS